MFWFKRKVVVARAARDDQLAVEALPEPRERSGIGQADASSKVSA